MYRAMLLLATACGSTTVYRVSSNINDGLPFTRRIAVHDEVIQLTQSWFRVDVTMTAKVPTIESKEKVLWNDVKNTVTVYFKGEDAAARLKEKLAQLSMATSYKAALDEVRKFESAGDAITPPPELHSKLWSDLVAWKTASAKDNTLTKDNSFERQILSDRCTIEHIASSDERYINVEVPRGGSSNATIKLAADGTLQEASGGVTDALPTTLASAVGTVLTSAGTFGGAALAANASVAAAQIAAEASLGISPRLYALSSKPTPDLPRGEPPEAILLGLSAQISPGRYVHTFELKWPFAQYRRDHGQSSGSAPHPGPTLADICNNPCFSMDQHQRENNECIVKFDVADGANTVMQAPEKKKPTEANK